MRISTRGEYGLRSMLVLARLYREGPVSLREIAQREQISVQYLEQLFRELRKEGLVNSHRGTRGGYQLALPPGATSIGSILRTLEGPLGPMQCVMNAAHDPGCCPHVVGKCPTRVLWKRLKHSIDSVLDETTLADLLTQVDEE
jgi:Rrf2 family protein